MDGDGDGNVDTTERYAYDGWQPGSGFTGNENWDIWADLDGSSSLTTRYVHGDAVDQLFARIGSGSTYWLLEDHLGSVRDIIDNTGAVKDSIAYDGYGNITSETNSAYRGRYTFNSREYDVETAFLYYRARYYSTDTGRWVTQDPLGFDAGDSNVYRYVMNKPTMARDPSGKFLQLIEDAFFPNFIPGYKPIKTQPVFQVNSAFTRVFGALKTIGGAVEIAAGVGLAGGGAVSTPATGPAGPGAAVLGILVAIHGVDSVSAGVTQVWTGQTTITYTERYIGYFLKVIGFSEGTSKTAAGITDSAISIVGSLGATWWRGGMGFVEKTVDVSGNSIFRGISNWAARANLGIRTGNQTGNGAALANPWIRTIPFPDQAAKDAVAKVILGQVGQISRWFTGNPNEGHGDGGGNQGGNGGAGGGNAPTSGLSVVPRPGMTSRTVTAANGRTLTVWGQAEHAASTTPGHAEAMNNLVNRLAATGEYEYVTLQRSWRTATGRVGTSRNIPDVIGVRRNGVVDAWEVQSATDVREVLLQRLQDGRQSLPAARRGSVQVIPPEPPAAP